MYLNFYGLQKEPFHITPDPDFLFLGPSHREALAAIIYGVEKRKGFVQISGEVGVGKTTILRTYLDQHADGGLRTVYLFNPNLAFPALLKTVCHELGFYPVAEDPDVMLRELHMLLIREYREGGNMALVIDEAQNVPRATLEGLRILSNLETSKDKLIQIVLSGQPELDETLNRHELRQLKQRIAVRATISPLNAQESADYIRHRLARAGGRDGLFSPGALTMIIRHSRGIPRLMNILCDNCLITAFGNQKKEVEPAVAREVIRDFDGEKVAAPRFRWSYLAVLLIFAIAAFVWFSLENSDGDGVRSRTTLSAPPVKQAAIRMALPARVEAPQPKAAGKSSHVERTVKAGDSLGSLVGEVYGQRSPGYVEIVKQYNSGIKDGNFIYVGERIGFPKIEH
jgi:general secretion pathway protein A